MSKEKTYVIENDLLAVKTEVNRNHISSFSVINKLNNKVIKGDDGSEVFTVSFKGFLFSKFVKASQLKLSDVTEFEVQNGKHMTFLFSSVKIKGRSISFALNYELYNNEHFIRKWLEIKTDKNCNAVLDFVDYGHIAVSDRHKVWSVPKQKKSHISGFALSLGQPVFIDSAFFGCEFPLTVNTVENGIASVKYYSGKLLEELVDEKGVYTCKKSVIGVADSDNDVRLRTALFNYIEKISRPIKLRCQYNSWYDHMLDISAENIAESFIEVEKRMTAVGSKPLDCYVVDDGWNDYTKDFWGFNSKFPNEFYPSSALTKVFGSSFGMWLGPRGGYTTDTIKFARKIQKGKNGYVNKQAIDIDVASHKYIRRTKEMMLDFQKRFDLDYWKLDGFAQRPCKNKKHDHITGGKNDMYFYSEVWEKWIDVFDSLQKAKEDGVFINLTCYAPPSPWFLQWVNTMWMQISDDMGTIEKSPDGKKLTASKKDKMLSYRDDRYYDFSKVRGFCFPLSNLYNHDPIYANEAKVEMNDDEFRSYLFSMAARGTCFWELYYSYNMMEEEKWRINNDVLLFLEENMHLLKKSVMFGGRPSLCQVYGYGCFGENEGIVTLRNAGSSSENYVLCLDHNIGADETLKDVSITEIFPYSEKGQYGSFSFGDKLNVSLAPNETKILHFGKKAKELEVTYIKALNENTAEVMFNQRIVKDGVYCDENPVKNVKLLDDYRSIIVTFGNSFKRDNSLTVSGVKDVLLNEKAFELNFSYYENCEVSDNVIKGNGDFTVVATTGGNINTSLFRQGDEIELYTENDYAYFRVGETTLKSSADIRNAVQITAVRERNGVLKLYIDKKPDSGLYAKSVCNLKGEEVTVFDEGKIKVYSKAFAYDEV